MLHKLKNIAPPHSPILEFKMNTVKKHGLIFCPLMIVVAVLMYVIYYTAFWLWIASFFFIVFGV